MEQSDPYVALGVQPGAEAVVITAAYRALANRYHPDRWSGDPAEAHRKMVVINAAYAILGDSTRRKDYDRTYTDSHSKCSFEDDQEQSAAFGDGLEAVSEQWQLACGVYPELDHQRSRLSSISKALSFSFVMTMLETKAFEQREQIAAQLESSFLKRHFGSNPKVVEYASSLISAGQKEAARRLNHLVNAMGSGVPAQRLIDSIEKEFGTTRQANKTQEAQAYEDMWIADLVPRVLKYGYYTDAKRLAYYRGYRADKQATWFSGKGEVRVVTPAGGVLRFENASLFVCWVRENLCG